jgi:excisionase family DNA binding protein
MKIEPEDLQLFKDILREVVREELKSYPSGMGRDRSADTVLDVAGVCEYLKVTPKWIHERTHLKEIPFYKLSNKQLRFRKRDIDKWLESLKTPAINQFSGKMKILK